jgi:hypothetical protein
MLSERASRRAFFGVSALLFAASAAVTIVECASMSAMGGMEMPGGWTMSTLWMRMPGQSWPGAAASFLGMWVAMMISMMLPSLAPVLWRSRQAFAMTDESRLARLTALISLGYFFVWVAVGMAVFAAGAAARLPPHGSDVRRYISGKRRRGLAAWPASRRTLQRLLRGPDSGASRCRGDELTVNGGRDGSHQPRTCCACRRARRASNRRGYLRRGDVSDCARLPAGMRNADRERSRGLVWTPRCTRPFGN